MVERRGLQTDLRPLPNSSLFLSFRQGMRSGSGPRSTSPRGGQYPPWGTQPSTSMIFRPRNSSSPGRDLGPSQPTAGQRAVVPGAAAGIGQSAGRTRGGHQGWSSPGASLVRGTPWPPFPVKPALFTPAAEADVEEAFQWYEAQREGLGASFRHTLDIAVAAIEANPEAYPVVHRSTRRVLLPKFPYGL
jgi:hypothetical protein